MKTTILWILVVLSGTLLASGNPNITSEVPLFGFVANVAKYDALNVREKPDYHSKKTGYLPLDAVVGIDTCKKVGRGRWCKVFPLGQPDYAGFDDDKPGWVNARYLYPDNRGYVIIDGKPNCDYALRCQKGKCEVVDNYKMDYKQDKIISMKTKWINRNRLKGTNNFAIADEPDASGMCDSERYIDEYLHQKKLQELEGNNHDKVKRRVISFVDDFSDFSDIDWIVKNMPAYLHPKKGIVMTWNVRFGGKEDMSFGYSDFKNMEKNRHKKIHWGQTYGKGDDVFMSLYDYMRALVLSSDSITKVERLKNLKGFKCPSGSECRGYEVFWINNASKTKEYDWQGMVVILEKYKGKWYVVGLLRDRWTI